MSAITLQDGRTAAASLVPDAFVDFYMPQANGEFVKIYLYLLRLAHSPNTQPTLSSLADVLSCTEKDVLRALRYWEKTGLLSLTFDGKVLCGISLRPLPETVYSENTAASEDAAAQKDADTGRASLREAGSEPVSAGSSKAAVPDRPARLSDSRVRQLRKDNSEVQQLLFLAEQYLGRTLSPTDISRILYFYDELRFPMDLLEYLIEYCVSRGNTSLHYIEKVGLEWHRDGIQTVKMAKTRTSTWNKSYFSILKAFGIRNRNPIPSETEFMDRWLKEYGFLTGYYRGSLCTHHHPDRAAQLPVRRGHSVQLEAGRGSDSSGYHLSGHKAQGIAAAEAVPGQIRPDAVGQPLQ